MPPTYSLTELAQAADVTPRTIRYYIAQGLLPSPGQAGPGARYSEGHRLRLSLIRQLQREHLPLAEIRQRLSALDDVEIEALLAEQSERPVGHRVGESAMEYIRGVLGGQAARARPPQTFALARRATPGDAAPERDTASLSLEPPAPMAAYALAMPGAMPRAQGAPLPDRSQWDRISLGPDVELHVRRPLTRSQNKRVERLIAIARALLEEDQP